MILRKLSILNYKNIREATLELSPKINCFIGPNGVGKTNVLDAVYYLSFCRSASNPIDSQVICHDEPFCMIDVFRLDCLVVLRLNRLAALGPDRLEEFIADERLQDDGDDQTRQRTGQGAADDVREEMPADAVGILLEDQEEAGYADRQDAEH